MKTHLLFRTSSILIGVVLSSLSAAQATGLRAEAQGATPKAPRPQLSVYNDGTGFGFDLDVVAPRSTSMSGELVLGMSVSPSALGGASSSVVPMVRVPVVLQPGVAGSLSASLPIPNVLVIAAMEFYAQGVVYGGGSSMRMTDPVPVGFDGIVALPKCVEDDSLAQSTAGGTAIKPLAGLPTAELIEAFEGPGGALAARAYHELYLRGTASIAPLLSLASKPSAATGPWASVQTFEARTSSFVRYEGGEPITIRRMALYLISAIAMGTETPYAVNELSDALYSGLPALELEALALAEVQAWWQAAEGRSLAQLRSQPRPLFWSPVDFGVPQGVLDPTLVFPTNAGLEDAAPGSSTALALGAAEIQARAGDQTFLTAATEEQKKDPYNCLSWAVHCDMCHGWVQPCKPSGAAIDGWMMMNGWSTTPPAGGASQTVSIQKHVDMAGRETWQHAMKKNADCSWSSKNGAGMFYPSFADPVCFGNMHYPPPAGSMSSFQNWYK